MSNVKGHNPPPVEHLGNPPPPSPTPPAKVLIPRGPDSPPRDPAPTGFFWAWTDAAWLGAAGWYLFPILVKPEQAPAPERPAVAVGTWWRNRHTGEVRQAIGVDAQCVVLACRECGQGEIFRWSQFTPAWQPATKEEAAPAQLPPEVGSHWRRGELDESWRVVSVDRSVRLIDPMAPLRASVPLEHWPDDWRPAAPPMPEADDEFPFELKRRPAIGSAWRFKDEPGVRTVEGIVAEGIQLKGEADYPVFVPHADWPGDYHPAEVKRPEEAQQPLKYGSAWQRPGDPGVWILRQTNSPTEFCLQAVADRERLEFVLRKDWPGDWRPVASERPRAPGV